MSLWVRGGRTELPSVTLTVTEGTWCGRCPEHLFPAQDPRGGCRPHPHAVVFGEGPDPAGMLAGAKPEGHLPTPSPSAPSVVR